MSAFVVCREHIDVLVRLAISGPADGDPASRLAFPVRVKDQSGRWRKVAPVDDLQHVDLIDPTDVGRILWAENHESVAHRYSERYDEEIVDEYRYQDPGFAPTCAEAARALSCLAYQSCEHPEWDESIALGIVQALRVGLLDALAGVDTAPWAWSEREIRDRRSGVAR